MKRSGPPARRTPLAARKAPLPGTKPGKARTGAPGGMKPATAPSRAAKKPPRGTGPSRETRALVHARAGGACERCGRTITPRTPFSLQHRIPRQMGGSANDPRINRASNLVLLCGSATTPGGCHLWAEQSRVEAMSLGYLVHRRFDPPDVPIVIRGRRVYLTDDGGYNPG